VLRSIDPVVALLFVGLSAGLLGFSALAVRVFSIRRPVGWKRAAKSRRQLLLILPAAVAVIVAGWLLLASRGG
jgi:hypothetical protein